LKKWYKLQRNIVQETGLEYLMIHIDEASLKAKYIAEGVRLRLSPLESAEFVNKLWPDITIGEERNGTVAFSVTPTAFGNLASCCIGADTNYRFHTGKRAVNQSSILINLCCAVICRFSGGILTSIAPDVTFENMLGIGETALLFASKKEWGPKERTTHLRGETSQGATLFTPRVITTRITNRQK